MKYPVATHPMFARPFGETPKPAEQTPTVAEPIDVTHSVVNLDRPTLEQTERETIRLSLERNGGRRRATALELNISERSLYRKIKEYGLE